MFPLWFGVLSGSLSSWTWVLPFCSLYSPFFWVLWFIYDWQGFISSSFVSQGFPQQIFSLYHSVGLSFRRAISGQRQNCPNFASRPPPCMKILVNPQRLGLTRRKNMPKFREDSPVTGNSQKPHRLSLSPPRFHGIIDTRYLPGETRGTRDPGALLFLMATGA